MLFDMSEDRPGHSDTPDLPHVDYGVHDPARPHPPKVDPGDFVSTSPPDDATVLFDGSDLSAWVGEDGGTPSWKLENEAMEVVSDTGDIRTSDSFGDCQLHLEWASPAEPEGESQGRGNSGVFLMDRYEIQVLDNYDNPTYADGYAAAIYGQEPPLVNACRPPGKWQSYDIVWRAPRFENGDLSRPARVTLLHNGVLVQDATTLIGPTTHGDVLDYEPHPSTAPVRLQDHHDPVRFRNIWIRSLDE